MRPRPCRIDQHACLHRVQRVLGSRRHGLTLQAHRPALLTTRGLHTAGAREHSGTAFARVHRVEHHQARVVHPAVGVDEATLEPRLQRRTQAMPTQGHAARARQYLATGQVVVQEQAQADQPRRPHVRIVRHHEAQRLHDVWRAAQQHLALLQSFAHQRELAVLQVAQATVDQLGRRRRGVRRQVMLLHQQHLEAPPGQVARDAHAIDATAHDQHVTAVRDGRVQRRMQFGISAVGRQGVGVHGQLQIRRHRVITPALGSIRFHSIQRIVVRYNSFLCEMIRL